MDVADSFLTNNAEHAEGHGEEHLDVQPSLQVAVVTCMDSRIDVFAALGLENGQAHILRNAGGVITTWDGGPAEEGGNCIAAATPELHAVALKELNG